MTGTPPPFLLPDEVDHISTMCDLTRARLERNGKFPRRVRIGNRKIAYRRSEIERWVADPEGWAPTISGDSQQAVIEPRAKVML